MSNVNMVSEQLNRFQNSRFVAFASNTTSMINLQYSDPGNVWMFNHQKLWESLSILRPPRSVDNGGTGRPAHYYGIAKPGELPDMRFGSIYVGLRRLKRNELPRRMGMDRTYFPSEP
ncbi:MAG: hypothetical protein KOO61_09945 [Spirochaetales bacterium]|nr:hypothetical protein [Spirochaetales bacterium]